MPLITTSTSLQRLTSWASNCCKRWKKFAVNRTLEIEMSKHSISHFSHRTTYSNMSKNTALVHTQSPTSISMAHLTLAVCCMNANIHCGSPNNVPLYISLPNIIAVHIAFKIIILTQINVLSFQTRFYLHYTNPLWLPVHISIIITIQCGFQTVYYLNYTVKPALKDHRSGHRNVDSQARWCVVRG